MVFTKQKRGTSPLLNVNNLIIIVVIILTFISVVRSLQTKEQYIVDFYAHDLVMTMEALQAVPGDVDIYYPLEEDYQVLLETGRVSVVHAIEDKSLSLPFHVLPDHNVLEGSATTVAHISKRNKILNIQSGEQTAPKTCAKPAKLQSSTFSAKAIPGSTTDENSFSAEEIILYAGVINNALKEAKIYSDNPTLTITFSAADPPSSRDQLIVKWPQGTSEQEQDYNYIYCHIMQHYVKDFGIGQGKLAADHYSMEIIVAINEDHEETHEAFIKAFQEDFTNILKTLRSTTT
jgi:hypothetical protein